MLYTIPWDWILVLLGLIGVFQALVSIILKHRKLVRTHEMGQEIFGLILSLLLVVTSTFETVKQTGRHLWPWQRSVLVDSLRNSCEKAVLFFYDYEDPEASAYFEELRGAMRDAGVKVDFQDSVHQRRRDQVPVDLGFGYNPSDACTPQFLEAFNAAHINIVLDTGNDYDIGDPQMFIGSTDSPHTLPAGKWSPPP